MHFPRRVILLLNDSMAWSQLPLLNSINSIFKKQLIQNKYTISNLQGLQVCTYSCAMIQNDNSNCMNKPQNLPYKVR